MAANGVLPNRLDACPLPIYAACLYWKATKLPRKTKTEISINEYKLVASVGDFVSVNLLIYNTIGRISHMSGFLTRQCYKYTRVFLDHNYDLTFVHLLKSQTGDEVFETN